MANKRTVSIKSTLQDRYEDTENNRQRQGVRDKQRSFRSFFNFLKEKLCLHTAIKNRSIDIGLSRLQGRHARLVPDHEARSSFLSDRL